MVAVLKPIEARALSAPIYDNSNLSVRDWWVTDNARALVDYWQACGGDDLTEDFEGFVWTQWDRETARRSEYRNTLRQS